MSLNAETGLYDGYIYCIENRINHKKYVGQTTVSVRLRYYQHISSMRNGEDTYLYRAMRQYGEDNFDVSVICKETSNTKDGLQTSLNEQEAFYIDTLNTYAPHGYNLTHGGQVFSENYTRPIMLISHDGTVTEAYPSIRSAAEANGIDEKNIQNACQSKSHFSGGLFWYYATPDLHVGDNIGVQSKGVRNWKGHKNYIGKRVCMMRNDGTKIQEFNSASEAGRIMNISQSNISGCCYGKRKSAGGYRWSFII